MDHNHYRRKEEELKASEFECIIWGKRRKVSNRMCLLGATQNVYLVPRTAVVAVMSTVLYGAAVVCIAVVGTTMCVHVRSNSWSSNSGYYLCVEWCVELCVAQRVCQ